MKRAGVGRGKRLDDSIRTDELAWLTQEDAQGAFTDVLLAFEGLMKSLNELAWLGLRSFDLQLARYGPGGRYAKHRDAFAGDDNRRVTAIVYLNPGWVAAHGGQLKLYVTPPVEVEPTLDRLIVFRSEMVEHEVLETKADRWALTAWFSTLLSPPPRGGGREA